MCPEKECVYCCGCVLCSINVSVIQLVGSVQSCILADFLSPSSVDY